MIVLHFVTEKLILHFIVPARPRHIDGVAYSTLHTCGRGLEFFCNYGIECLCDQFERVRILGNCYNRGAEECVSFTYQLDKAETLIIALEERLAQSETAED